MTPQAATMAERAHNFSAGPAALPESVLAQAQAELLDYRGSGMSVMEMSHRSAEFIDVAERAEASLRRLLGLGDGYRVLFLQGGATLQFAMVPMNLASPGATVDYVDTGAWSKKAIAEAGKFAEVNVAASSAAEQYSHIPAPSEWRTSADAAYLHLCSNETIGGLQFSSFEGLGYPGVPLVADMSSDFLSRPLDVSRFGLIYAGAQKNVGPAGITLVLIREDLLERSTATLPGMLDYSVHAAAGSMSNTPPTFAWYMAGLVFDWLLEQGGLAGIEAVNRRKADTLYDAIDNSNFYSCPVQPAHRSVMNVPFTLHDAALDGDFLAGAKTRGLLNLKGHRSVGGMRASLYNAVSQDSVDALVNYMADFEGRH